MSISLSCSRKPISRKTRRFIQRLVSYLHEVTVFERISPWRTRIPNLREVAYSQRVAEVLKLKNLIKGLNYKKESLFLFERDSSRKRPTPQRLLCWTHRGNVVSL